MKRKRHSSEASSKTIAASAQTRERTGALKLICAFLIFIQPVIYFAIPLVRYDEFRLPARESAFMLNTSIDAWWRVLVVGFGIVVGVKLWRRQANAMRNVKLYLLAYLASACLLVAFPYFTPFHSFLRSRILAEQSRLFLESLMVVATGYGCLVLSRSQKSAGAASSNALPLPWCARGLTAVSVTLGMGCSVAALHTAPRDIFEAAWEGNSAAVHRFVATGVDVNSFNPDQSTPLHLAATRGIAEFLTETSSGIEESYLLKPDDLKNASSLIEKLRLRADPVSALLWSHFSVAGRDALTNQYFSEWELPAVVLSELNSVLRQRLTMNVDAFDGVRLSSSTIALKSRRWTGMETLNLNRHLLEDAFPQEIAKYQIDARNLLKETPLHIAAFNGRMDVSSFLVERGAWLNASNHNKWTPLDYALFARTKGRKGGFDSVISLLVQQGATANVPQHRAQLQGLARSGRFE